jgi:single-stranded-DNA-specific exonuclease
LFDLLMVQRGVVQTDRQAFLSPDFDRDIYDPYLFRDMKVAVQRISKSAQNKERVLVYGDYDVDGITSVAILMTALRKIGLSPVPYLPDRTGDGYGLNKNVLDELLKQFDLLVTVDCGVSNGPEIKHLVNNGKDVIVTDHHDFTKGVPAALAVLHPRHPEGKYPFPWLSGAGVAWSLARAVVGDLLGETNSVNQCLAEMMAMACLGTVADSVPLVGENRAIVHYGLKALRYSDKPGIKVLRDHAVRAGKNLDEEDLAYRVIPLLNAAGRIDHAQPSLDLLIAQDLKEAESALARLKTCNQRRVTWSKKVISEAEVQVKDMDAPVIFASDPAWPAGIVGLVANRLSERFCRPAIVVGGGGDHAVGSGRAPAGMNILNLISQGKSHLLKFGGHECAVGFSLSYDKVDVLREQLVSGKGKGFNQGLVEEILKADVVVGSNLIDWQTVEMLDKMAPYGEGNKRPVFLSKGLVLIEWRVVGKTGEHVKFSFQRDNDIIGGIGFGVAKDCELSRFKVGEKVDVVYSLEVNDYQGRQSLQINVKDVARAGTVQILAD